MKGSVKRDCANRAATHIEYCKITSNHYSWRLWKLLQMTKLAIYPSVNFPTLEYEEQLALPIFGRLVIFHCINSLIPFSLNVIYVGQVVYPQ